MIYEVIWNGRRALLQDVESGLFMSRNTVVIHLPLLWSVHLDKSPLTSKQKACSQRAHLLQSWKTATVSMIACFAFASEENNDQGDFTTQSLRVAKLCFDTRTLHLLIKRSTKTSNQENARMTMHYLQLPCRSLVLDGVARRQGGFVFVFLARS